MVGNMFTVTMLFLLGHSYLCASSDPEVLTKLGKIVGTETATSDKTPVYRFLGIPYAKPPLGLLRFKDPQPWTDKYNGYLLAKYPRRCVQYLRNIDLVTGDEDCLHLNIYTTSLSRSSNFHVLVYIHGGGFMYGAGHAYTPEFLLTANKQLVYVSINYRLGPLGFLSTEDEVVPGNMGLKDQVMALKWIQKNIVHFGGDPYKVVLMGLGAGGTSVHLHYLSTMSRDLFARGISMSGAAFSFLMESQSGKQSAKTLAKLNKCPSYSSKAMLQCLQKVDAKELVQKLVFSHLLPWDRFHASAHFEPIVEKMSKVPFMDQHPYYMLLQGKAKEAPWLVGVAIGEGEKSAAIFANNVKKLEDLNSNWEKVAPHLLIFSETCEDKLENTVSQQIRDYYFGSKPISLENKDTLVEMLGDRLYMTGVEKCLRLHTSFTSAPVYMYMFEYIGKYSMAKIFTDAQNDLSVCHVDDIIYVLGLMDIEPMIEDSRMVNEMMEIWNSFIRDGVPSSSHSPQWPQVPRDILHAGEIHFLRIKGPDQIVADSSEDISNYHFWDHLPLNELHLSGDEKIPDRIKKQSQPYKDKSVMNRLADLFGF